MQVAKADLAARVDKGARVEKAERVDEAADQVVRAIAPAAEEDVAGLEEQEAVAQVAKAVDQAARAEAPAEEDVVAQAAPVEQADRVAADKRRQDILVGNTLCEANSRKWPKAG